MERPIEARMILEILGRPAEHIVSTLEELVNRLKNENGVKVLKHKVYPPILAKDSKDIYTTFAEIELEFASLPVYMGIIFAYMPANIEIISPERFNLSNIELSSLGSSVLDKLHFYESVAKRLVSEREILKQQLNKGTEAKEPVKKQKKSKKKSKSS